MIKYFFKTALRKVMRNQMLTVINILGLSLGFACALVVFFSSKF